MQCLLKTAQNLDNYQKLMGLKKALWKDLFWGQVSSLKRVSVFKKKNTKTNVFSRNKYLTYPAKTLAIIYTFLRSCKFAGTLLLSVVSLEERKREREREREREHEDSKS